MSGCTGAGLACTYGLAEPWVVVLVVTIEVLVVSWFISLPKELHPTEDDDEVSD